MPAAKTMVGTETYTSGIPSSTRAALSRMPGTLGARTAPRVLAAEAAWRQMGSTLKASGWGARAIDDAERTEEA